MNICIAQATFLQEMVWKQTERKYNKTTIDAAKEINQKFMQYFRFAETGQNLWGKISISEATQHI